MFVGAFLELGVFTHLHLFICVKLIISVRGCFMDVMVRHESSRIIANLVTRLGSS